MTRLEAGDGISKCKSIDKFSSICLYDAPVSPKKFSYENPWTGGNIDGACAEGEKLYISTIDGDKYGQCMVVRTSTDTSCPPPPLEEKSMKAIITTLDRANFCVTECTNLEVECP